MVDKVRIVIQRSDDVQDVLEFPVIETRHAIVSPPGWPERYGAVTAVVYLSAEQARSVAEGSMGDGE